MAQEGQNNVIAIFDTIDKLLVNLDLESDINISFSLSSRTLLLNKWVDNDTLNACAYILINFKPWRFKSLTIWIKPEKHVLAQFP